MLNRVGCVEERHAIGGDGQVYLARFEDIAGRLVEEYGGRARVVYLDPPFGTGATFEFKQGKRQTAYTDKLSDAELLNLMRQAVELCRALLAADGTLFIHVDYRLSAKLRIMCDELLGDASFTNEIIWAYKSGGRTKKYFSRKHDVILMYRMSGRSYFNIDAIGVPRGQQRRNHMRRGIDDDGRIYYAITTRGKEYRYYEDDLVYPSDVWDDIEHLHQRDPERTGFVTQKPEALLSRIILSCSREGDTVIDLFGGSGTTASVAAQNGRRFVSVDCGGVSLTVTRRRLIERVSALKMFAEAKPLTVFYPEALCAAPDDFSVESIAAVTQTQDGYMLKLKSELAAEAPAYIASGRIENGVFYASGYMLRPRSAAKLSIERGGALHIVDSECRHAFFELS